MKIYEKPDVEYISLAANEEIANGGFDGGMDVVSNGGIFPLG